MIAFVLHALYSATIAFFLSSIAGGLAPWIAIVSLLIGTKLGVSHARLLHAQSPDLKFFSISKGESGAIEAFLIGFVMFATVRHFGWLLFPADHRWMSLNPNNFGDLPLHIGYIRAIANEVAFPLANPNFAEQILRYPFGCDLYNALWEILGVPLTAHLFFTGVFCAVASLTTLKWFGKWWAIGAFFLSGGIAGWDVIVGSAPLENLHGPGIEWKNFFLSVFVTQRGMMFALPVGLLLLEMTRRHFSGETTLSRPVKTVLGSVWAILPFFHAHTFVAVSLLMTFYALNYRGWKGAAELLKSRMAVIAYLPATYFVLRAADSGRRADVIRFDWWWTSTFEEAPEYLWRNFGFWLLLPLLLAFVLFLRRKEIKGSGLWFELAMAVGFFAVFFNVMLAPWSWDNVKVLVWPYLIWARLGSVVIDPKLIKGARLPFAVALFFSGFLAITYSIQTPSARGLTIYSFENLADTKGALEKVPVNAVLATAPSHDHPITYFGRLRVMGHDGHMWSHGIDSSVVAPKLEMLMQGHPNWQTIAKELGVTHIFWGAQERGRYGTNRRPFMELKNVSRVPNTAVYEVN